VTYTRGKALSGAQAGVAMEVVIAVQSGPLVYALKLLQRRGVVRTHRGGGHHEVPFSLVLDTGPEGLEFECKHRAWGLTAHRGWARLMLDRRSLVQAPNAPRDQSQDPCARNNYDEETAYESCMNPEPGFQFGLGTNAD